MTQQILKFNELGAHLEHSILQLKRSCFDYTNNLKVTGWDEYDREATHILSIKDGRVVAYGRVCKRGTFLTEASFSRICVDKNLQALGLGKTVIKQAIEVLRQSGNKVIQIIVREPLINYYRRIGFSLQFLNPVRDYYYSMTYRKHITQS
jgi:ElaA protein